MSQAVDVLVAGAGPVGLMLACDLARRGVTVRIVEKLSQPLPQIRAVGIASRSLEIFEDLGVLDIMLAGGLPERFSRIFVNGQQTLATRVDGYDAPYPFMLHLAQPQTERILAEHLTTLGVTVERGCELIALRQDNDGVDADVRGPDGGAATIRCRYLVGCDGAHSIVRKQLGLRFEGESYPVDLMLAHGRFEWPIPHDGISRCYGPQGFVVAVTIPGDGEDQFRVSGTVEALRVEGGEPVIDSDVAASDAHRPPPSAADVEQYILDHAGITARIKELYWTSYFHISMRQVPQYRIGRVFVAGDAAHIHPPTGGQGMNTGLQDAYNLGWKLALAVKGAAADGLLDSYQTERHPVGAATVQRTHQASMSFLQPPTDPTEDEKAAVVNSMLLINYRGSPLVGPANADVPPSVAGGDPQPGDRAPDAKVVEATTGQERRLFELWRGPKHTLLLYADKPQDKDALRRVTELANAVRARRGEQIAVQVIFPAGATAPPKSGTVLLDRDGAFRRAYGTANLYLVRPDKHIGFRSAAADGSALNAHLRGIFR